VSAAALRLRAAEASVKGAIAAEAAHRAEPQNPRTISSYSTIAPENQINMKNILIPIFVIGVLLTGLYGQVFAEEPPTKLQSVDTDIPAKFTGLITFAYYEEIEEAEKFYTEVMGLNKSYHRPRTRIFQITPTAALGLMDLGAVEDVEIKDKAAGFSFIVQNVDDVDEWAGYLKSKGVEILVEPSDGTRTPVRSVHFLDTDGYDIEIFAWLPNAQMIKK
jgi:catechol 2,3-dioxygenase-like lactoylglutathione lyase family enzyme